MKILDLVNIICCIVVVLSKPCLSLPADAKFSQEFEFESLKPSKLNLGDDKCGYESCNLGKEGMINVHLVPHTHDDAGWLKTVDQYYYGSHQNIQNAGVQYILDTVIQELRNNPNRRFSYCEMGFFSRWWNQQHDNIRHIVKGMVNKGQLQFILGGWVQNDEATTHYNAIIDQHTEGLKFLQSNFGDCGRPRVAWQIDPFGHSREMASLFAQMHYDAVYFARIDYQDRELREKTKDMEMIWKGSPQNLGDSANLFTGALARGSYGPPTDMCFNCGSDPVMDDQRLHDYNVDKLVKRFINITMEQAKQFKTNHLMWTMGVDFGYADAKIWFKNQDKLINYVNALQAQGSKVNALYSTPACYTLAKNRAKATWATKEDDFFPYAHTDHGFWTGYFTSRAALKGYVRQTNNFLQVAKQMDIISQLDAMASAEYKLTRLGHVMGLLQHHDAVSGTEKQAVAYDYAMRLAEGVTECQEVINDAYKKLLPKASAPPPEQFFCSLLNISACHVTEENKRFIMTVYNPLGRNTSTVVRLPVAASAYTVLGPAGEQVATQIIPVSIKTKSIPERHSTATQELVFKVSVPALGFKTYFIQYTSDFDKYHKSKSHEDKPVPGEDMIIKNKHLKLSFDSKTGQLKTLHNLASGVNISVSQALYYYQSFIGNNSKGIFRSSGAYIFRPNGSTPHPISSKSEIKYIKGQVVQEVHQTYSDWATSITRLYEGAQYAEYEWTVGPIPIKDGIGKEVISRFCTNMKTAGVFYTDANGREIQTRKRDYRPTWDLNQTEPVAGNYYPVNSRIFIRDASQNVQLTVLNDRSQGGASIQDGCVELMVHRRVLHDDALGVGEPLNETGSDGKGLIIRGKHWLYVDTIANSNKFHRDTAERLYMGPLLTFSNSQLGISDYTKMYNTMWSGMKSQLPDNVHLLTLQNWRNNSVLMRLEHFYEKNEDPTLSQPAQVKLKGLFAPFDVTSVNELTLTANQNLKDAKRLEWNFKGKKGSFTQSIPKIGDDFTITLQPMQIRTFQITVA